MTECIHGCTLKKDELRLRAAKLFTPKPWEHDGDGWDSTVGRICSKCKLSVDERDGACTIPDPIDINDWNVAYEIFRSLDVCERTNARSELVQIFLRETKADADTRGQAIAILLLQANSWLWNFGEPKHLIKAACEAKERE